MIFVKTSTVKTSNLAESVYCVTEYTIWSLVSNILRFSHIPKIISENRRCPEGTNWHRIGKPYSNEHDRMNSLSYCCRTDAVLNSVIVHGPSCWFLFSNLRNCEVNKIYEFKAVTVVHINIIVFCSVWWISFWCCGITLKRIGFLKEMC